MIKNILTRGKSVIISFGKMSTKQISIIILNLLNSIFSKGMYFFAFFGVFLYDPNTSTNSNVSMILITGVAIVLWFLVISTLKDQKMQYITPIKGSIFRALYDMRYIVLVIAMFYYFNLTYSQFQFYIYCVIILVSLILARLCEAVKINLLGKDWLTYEQGRK